MLGGGYDVADAGLAATSATATVLAMAIRVSAALVVRLTRFSYRSSPAVAGDAETADVQCWLDCVKAPGSGQRPYLSTTDTSGPAIRFSPVPVCRVFTAGSEPAGRPVRARGVRRRAA